ncbi:hypothetical protein EZL74_03595 [Flavobacterium silvisoli]|uniref:Uncharacterized protein n=1 Tax=Flavobacterium silvisoli TaxID=2529433 RepID=A0A4Q9Z3G0_9FLAO|nr:hypothetical protein [Flavobacterium silvisoli]TBX70770.1 hypothetical protein EZL74_03595 [Flavobacterium silvisoli]
MKITFLSLLLSLVCLSSCQEDPKLRALEQEREAQKREIIFNNINKGWTFNAQPINTTSRNLTANWAEWRTFLNELNQKPKSSLGAFQQKAKTLSKKASELNNNIPAVFDLPETRSRIDVIATKMNSINLFIHLNQIPDKKVVQLVQEVNVELTAFQNQLDEIVRKSQIKMEEGESDMLQMLDTARAIPTNNPNLTPVK